MLIAAFPLFRNNIACMYNYAYYGGYYQYNA